jgi:GT2 family glycosyltransferase
VTIEHAAPRFSVVVPVRDGGEAFARCLGGLARSRCRDFELIVVDDGSADGSARRAAAAGAAVLSTPGAAGPAAARNLGAAAARGEWLLFLDADCELHADAVERLGAAIDADPGLDAVFGAYDDRPAAPGVVSRFRNLLHAWTHRRHAGPAETFWAGCGAVRREVFLAAGGFDAARYPRSSIEDVELGFRLSAAGQRILLAPEVQVTHHKRWTFASMVATDIARRALPWTALGRRRGGLGRVLNVDARGRGSALAAWALVAGLAAAPSAPRAGAAAAAAAGVVLLVLNAGFYRFLAAAGGPRLALAGPLLHAAYFLYASAAFAWGTVRPSPRQPHGAPLAAPAPRGPR